MKASFSHIIRYQVEGLCVSPLRTGNAEGDVDRVLLTPDGTPMIQAASIAGAMNAWRPDPTLFGDSDHSSSLRFTDAVFQNAPALSTRPRVRINGVTGCADDKGKFDVASLPPGTKWRFELLWYGTLPIEGSEEKNALARVTSQIEDYLSAVQAGETRFGAQKSNGFGEVELKATRQIYCMFREEDRKAWLQGTDKGSPVTIIPTRTKYVCFSVEAKNDAVLVKTSAPTGTGKGKIDAVQITEIDPSTGKDRPIIPGSSIKGAMRDHMGRIAPFLGMQGELSSLLGSEATPQLDNSVAGKIIFSDASVTNAVALTVRRYEGLLYQMHLLVAFSRFSRWASASSVGFPVWIDDSGSCSSLQPPADIRTHPVTNRVSPVSQQSPPYDFIVAEGGDLVECASEEKQESLEMISRAGSLFFPRKIDKPAPS